MAETKSLVEQSHDILVTYMKACGYDNEERAKKLLRNEAETLRQKIQRGFRPENWTSKQLALLRYIKFNKIMPDAQIKPILDAAEIEETLRQYNGESADEKKAKRAKLTVAEEEAQMLDGLKAPADEHLRLDEKLFNSNDINLEGSVSRQKILDLSIRLLVSSSPMKEIFNIFDRPVHEDLFRLAHLLLSVATKIEFRDQLVKPEEARKLLTDKEYAVLPIYQNALKSAKREQIVESLHAFIRYMRTKLGVDRQVL